MCRLSSAYDGRLVEYAMMHTIVQPVLVLAVEAAAAVQATLISGSPAGESYEHAACDFGC